MSERAGRARSDRAPRMEIGVLVVDDFPLVRKGIVSALRADPAIKVLGEATTCAEAVRLAEALRPDVLLIDLRLPDGDGIGLVRLLAAGPGAPAALVISAVEKPDAIREAAAAGARGYLSKRTGPSELRDAIVTAYGGGLVFDRVLDGAPLRRSQGRIRAASPDPRLTEREREVLALVARGATDREVAERLALSVRTVQNHLAAVRRKTGLRRRSKLASWAITHAFD